MALNTSALSKHKAVLFDYRSVQCELRSVRNSSGQNRSNSKLGIVVSSLLRERLLDEDICKQNGLNQVTIVDQSWILLFVSLKLCVKLGRYCVELHYGTIIGTLSLFLLAVTRLRWKTGSNFVLQNRNRPTLFPQCNSKQHQLSLTHSRPQCFRVWE